MAVTMRVLHRGYSQTYKSCNNSRRIGIRRFSNDRFAPRTSFNLKNGLLLHVAQGDLTQFQGDAIVNAANERMLGGGGVDGAIHRAAGPELLNWIKENIPIITGYPNSRCLTGNAVLTPGFALKVGHIIHTVGPIYADHQNPEILLRKCYDNSLCLAVEQTFESIAFPAISCGVYGYPKGEAIEIAFTSFEEMDRQCLHEVWFLVFGKEMFEEALAVADDLFD